MFKKCLNEHFSNIDYWPTSLTHKIENKNENGMHNYNDSIIQIQLIWFYSFSTFGTFVWKSKPDKALQRAITRDRKLIF